MVCFAEVRVFSGGRLSAARVLDMEQDYRGIGVTFFACSSCFSPLETVSSFLALSYQLFFFPLVSPVILSCSHLTSVLQSLSLIGYDSNNIHLASYDWRLVPRASRCDMLCILRCSVSFVALTFPCSLALLSYFVDVAFPTPVSFSLPLIMKTVFRASLI
jgi:hypothetical protein